MIADKACYERGCACHDPRDGDGVEVVAKSEQEPVALETVYETIIQWDEGGGKRSRRELARRIVSLYTTPPQRTWVGLTDEEVLNALKCLDSQTARLPQGFKLFAQSIESILKEKNT